MLAVQRAANQRNVVVTGITNQVYTINQVVFMLGELV